MCTHRRLRSASLPAARLELLDDPITASLRDLLSSIMSLLLSMDYGGGKFPPITASLRDLLSSIMSLLLSMDCDGGKFPPITASLHDHMPSRPLTLALTSACSHSHVNRPICTAVTPIARPASRASSPLWFTSRLAGAGRSGAHRRRSSTRQLVRYATHACDAADAADAAGTAYLPTLPTLSALPTLPTYLCCLRCLRCMHRRSPTPRPHTAHCSEPRRCSRCHPPQGVCSLWTRTSRIR